MEETAITPASKIKICQVENIYICIKNIIIPLFLNVQYWPNVRKNGCEEDSNIWLTLKEGHKEIGYILYVRNY